MRGDGQTKAMVMALPADGAVVVVHNASIRRYVLQMVADVRGQEVARRCKVIVIECGKDLHQLCGLRVPVHVDHAFWDCSPLRIRRETMAYIERINATFPAAA